MAVIAAVPEFGRALLRPLGAPVGRTETFIEVPFKVNGKPLRPDGLILVTRGSKSWTALVETKVGNTQLQSEQMNLYLDLARDLSVDAVLSISNHLVTSSNEYPVEVDRRKLRKVALHHWSWIDVLTEAVVQREHRGVSDPDQAYILHELIRYLSDARSGAVALDSMGPAWTKVRDGARNHTLRRGDEHVTAVAGRWDELVRYIGLGLTKDLGRDVKQLLSKAERSPTARLNGLQESLASSGSLYAELQIPDAVGPLRIVADLRARQITISTRVAAPRTGRSKGRVSWLLRQLAEAPETLRIESRIARSRSSLAATLQTARESPESLYPDGQKEIREFELSLTRNLGLKRDASKGSFIESVVSATKDFYGDVLQHLRAWKAAPPKLKRLEERPEEEIISPRAPDEIRTAIGKAEGQNEDDALEEFSRQPDEAQAPDDPSG
ncbi:MAG: hypothetical protein ACRDK3_14585 [Actinomycetota bacterium]